MTPFCVVVRHGNTFEAGELPRRIGISTDLPLVEAGRAQALRLGEHFGNRGWRFDRALSSPLARTRETAELILSCGATNTAIEHCAWLAEIDHGPDENRSEAEVIARIGEEALAAWEASAVGPPDWRLDAAERMEAWRTLFERPITGVSLLVTSNGAARFGLLAHPRLSAQAAELPSLKLATGSFGVIALQDDGPHLVSWNERP